MQALFVIKTQTLKYIWRFLPCTVNIKDIYLFFLGIYICQFFPLQKSQDIILCFVRRYSSILRWYSSDCLKMPPLQIHRTWAKKRTEECIGKGVSWMILHHMIYTFFSTLFSLIVRIILIDTWWEYAKRLPIPRRSRVITSTCRSVILSSANTLEFDRLNKKNHQVHCKCRLRLLLTK